MNLGLVACGSDGGKGTSCESIVLVQQVGNNETIRQGDRSVGWKPGTKRGEKGEAVKEP